MALAAYVQIKGQAQGQFKGNSIKTTRKDWIEVLDFSSAVVSPRDAASGQPSGKRLYHPLTVLSEVGAHTPQMRQALTNNETLSTVVFEWEKPNVSGQLQLFLRITLTDGNFASHEISTTDSSNTALVSNVLTELFELTFAKIEIEELLSNISMTDLWMAPA